MKTTTKKIGVLLAAIVMVCTILVGCGTGTGARYDSSTPDGAIMAQLDALKTGDLSGLPDYKDANLDEMLSQVGVSETQIKDLLTGFFGKSLYKVEKVVNISSTEAEVTVSGMAVDMSKFLPIVVNEITSRMMEFSTKEESKNMTSEEAGKKLIAIVIDSLNAKQPSAEMVDVKVTLTMEKQGNVWDIDTQDMDNMDAIVELLFGDTLEGLQESMYDMFSNNPMFSSFL